MLDLGAASRRVPVRHLGHSLDAQTRVRGFAREIGFDALVCEELAIVVAELASNLIKHAGGGTLELAVVRDAGRIGLRIDSRDLGVGISNPEWALGDGRTTGGSLGSGLGAVNRLMDELSFEQDGDGGHIVRCIRWLLTDRRSTPAQPLEFGVASRPHPMENVNGDEFVVCDVRPRALVGVIDGLGHGHKAHAASTTARSWIERHLHLSLEQLFEGVGRACCGTNGVVMALAEFDCAARSLSFGTLGNIETRLLADGRMPHLQIQRGILGGPRVQVKIRSYDWRSHYILVMHSDGIRSTWDPEQLGISGDRTASAISSILLRNYSRDTDDATVLVVKATN